ncbi:MAG: universal stress protein [Candidatus Manganitrophus sp. SA1]|nr:universal stress protein [Candidatus Manganitrophus morganii]
MMTPRRILVATDFSECSKDAIDSAACLAACFSAELFLLHVFEPPFYTLEGREARIHPEVDRWVRELREKESKKLDGEVEAVKRQGINVRPYFKEGSPLVEILKVAEEIGADLVVLGTHGRTGMDRFVMGSVAERVTRKAPCSVLIIREKHPGGG